MTTIAYKDGVLACDSRVTSGGNFIHNETVHKIGLIEKHGLMYGVAGLFYKALSFIRELEALDKLPWNSKSDLSFNDPDGEVYLTIIDHAGRVFQFEYGHWAEVEAPYVTIGSGCVQAATAMFLGHGAIDAIKIAIQMDSSSGGEIRSLNVADLVAPPEPIKWPAPFMPHLKR